MIEEFHPKLSVIIPSKCGEARLAQLVTETLSAFTSSRQLGSFDVECIVSLHESDTAELPNFSNLKVVRSNIESRAHQLNVAVQASRSTWLWFLHADSKLSESSYAAISKEIVRNDGSGEIFYFPLRFDSMSKPAKFLNAPFANLRSKIFKLPFGDQSFLMTKDSFEKIGKFPTIYKSGEDHAFIQTARRLGFKILALDGTIETSSRKYRERGWLKTSLRHLYLTLRQEFSRNEQ